MFQRLLARVSGPRPSKKPFCVTAGCITWLGGKAGSEGPAFLPPSGPVPCRTMTQPPHVLLGCALVTPFFTTTPSLASKSPPPFFQLFMAASLYHTGPDID